MNRDLNRSLELAKRFGYSLCFSATLSDIDMIEDVKRTGFLS